MNILLLGALPKNEERKQLYEVMINICKDHDVSSPIDTLNFQGSEKERFERALQKLGETDLIIGEQSLPSTGQGIEIGIAYGLNKPLIVIAKTGSKISGLVKGCSILKHMIYYDDKEDLGQKLTAALKSL